MKRTILLIFFLFPVLLFALNAPITTAGSSGVCPGASFPIPVTVVNFTQITAMTLRLDYDPTLMTYTGYANVNTSLTGVLINQVQVSSTLNKILVAWSSVTPLTLSSGSKLFDLNFTLISGFPVLAFNNTAGGGSECEYADLNGNAMNDIPTESYYINAVITNLTVPAAGVITGMDTVCTSQTGVAYSIPPITVATSYIWTVPQGATIASGATTNSIIVNYSASASSGNITAAGVNSCGTGPSSSLFVTVNQLPGASGSITGPSPVCAGVSGVAYSVAPIPNTLTYVWLLPPGAILGSGAGTNTITVNFTVSATSGNIIVYGNNLCGNGANSPPFPVIVNPLPDAAGLITGPDHVCSGDSGLLYFTDPIPNATSYVWTIPPGAVIASGSGTNAIIIDYPTGASSGPVNVYGVNSCGTGTTSPNLYVIVYPIPSAPTITLSGDTLYSSSTDGNQWYLNQNLIPGATASYFVPEITGYYTCTITLNGCSSDSSNSIYVLVTGIKESNDVKWMIYPNPNNGAFNLLISAGKPEVFTMKAYNNLGIRVAEMENLIVNYADEYRIDLHSLPHGIYYIILINEKYALHQKIIINN
ncbi:MAG: T9SS type A sorting domain-containing protein [Bacteroidales bacterium]